jgi:uncharacterized membrane protein
VTTPLPQSTTLASRSFAISLNRIIHTFAKHWLLLFNVLIGLYVWLPWLAPVFMKLGWESAGNIIYTIYSTQCHQLPERSFFLFGDKFMYSLAEVQAAWRNTNSPFILRQFIGNETMGWKVAWSDRMVSMYTTIFFVGVLHGAFRKWLRPMPLWAFALSTLPMAIDGGTHLISDLAGIGNGFRDSNAWLALITNNAFSPLFYVGDAVGSFNWWMRLITGIIFGVGIVWLAYPHLEDAFAEVTHNIENKFHRAGLRA